LKEGIAPLGVLNYAGFWYSNGGVCDRLDHPADREFFHLHGDHLIHQRRRQGGGMVMLTQFLIGLTLQVTLNVLFVGRFGATPGKMALT